MLLDTIPSDPVTLLLALFVLFGLPLIIFSIVLFYAGFVRYEADQSLEELEAELEEDAETVGERESPEAVGKSDSPETTGERDASEPNTDQ